MKTSSMLYETIRPGILKAGHEQLIRAIDAHNFEAVAKKTGADLARFGASPSSDYLQRGILGLKQYYAVAILDPLNMHAVSIPVDDFWHSHVLFTQNYEAFCRATAGYFMHHEPLEQDNTPEVANVKRLYQYTLKCFDHLFWHVDAQMWPKAASEGVICTHFGNSISSLKGIALLPRLAEMQPEAVFNH